MKSLSPEAACYFRDQFRAARAVALKDAEAFEETVFVLERLGGYLNGKGMGLGQYEKVLAEIAEASPLARELPCIARPLHTPFRTLYNLIREARNAALHEGAFARHLTTHAIEVSIIMEDALNNELARVSDYMVRDPVCISPWQPLSFVRQTMLAHSYSYLPVLTRWQEREGWWIVADYSVAHHLRLATSKGDRNRRLSQSLQEAVDSGALSLLEPSILPPDTPIGEALSARREIPALILEPTSGRLLGILTAFDLL